MRNFDKNQKVSDVQIGQVKAGRGKVILQSKAIGTQKQWSAFYSAKRPVMADLIADGAPEDEMARYYSGKYRKSPLIESAYEADNFFAFGWVSFSKYSLKKP